VILHFVEIWALLLVTFIVGCALGAAVYGLVAESGLATTQGAVADAVGDVVDGIKAKLGVGPVWRPEYRHLVERPPPDETPVPVDAGIDQSHRSAGESDAWADGEFHDDEQILEPAPDWHADEEVAGEQRWREESAEPLDRQVEDAPPLGSEADRTRADRPEPPEAVRADPGDELVPVRPVGLSVPRNGVPDNLQKIRGIGGRNEQLLNSFGIYHFGQIAAWTPAEIKWIGERLAFPERIERDDWIGQAIVLASGGDTGFVKSAERRRAKRRQEWDSVDDVGVGEDQP
jgi:predicted flap endonuclease-1-like 5' DNA nuclease